MTNEHHDTNEKQSSVEFILIGTALALAGGFFAGLANILVKWVGVTKGPKLDKYKNVVWTLVIISYVLNGLCDFAAFAFAPLSVVAPISALTIATNAALAYVFFKEKLTKLDALGSVLVIAGSAIATSVGSRQSSDRTLDELNALWARTEWIIFASFEIISMLVLIVMTRYLGPTWPGLVPWLRSIITRTAIQQTEVSSISQQKEEEPSSVSTREPAVNKNPVLPLPVRSDSVSTFPTFHRNDSTRSVVSIVPSPSNNTTQPIHVTRNSMIHVDVDEINQRHNSSFVVRKYVHDKLRHQMRAVCYAFLASYLANWTNVLGKIAAEIVSSSIRGNNGFTRFESYLIIAGVIFFAFMQLKCMTEMMAIFEAVLIIPIYQCVFMITLIICGAVFFDEFETMHEKNIAIFCSAIIICCIGVYVLSQRAPPQLGVKPQRSIRSIKPLESQIEVDEDEMNLQHVTVTTPAHTQHVIVGEPAVHTVIVDVTSPLTVDSPRTYDAVDEVRPAVVRVSSTSRGPPTLVRPISNSSVYNEMHVHPQPEYAAYETPPKHIRSISQQVTVPPIAIPSPSDGVSEIRLLQ